MKFEKLHALKSKIDAALKENEKTDKEQKLLVALKNYMNNLYQEENNG